MNVWFFSLLFALPIAGIALVVGIHDLRKRQKFGKPPPRGTAPGRGGDTLVNHGNEMGGGHGGGHPTAHRVTKDPQIYAKAFVPETTEKDN